MKDTNNTIRKSASEQYQEDLKNYLASNQSDRTGGSFLAGDGVDVSTERTVTSHNVHSYIENTDWKAESDYFNYTRVNGKNNIGRTLKKGMTRLITPEEADQWALEAGLTLDD